MAGVVLVAAVLAGSGAVALMLTSDHYPDRTLWAVFLPLLGWSFVGTGLFAWVRRPESRVGLLMMVIGFAWLLKALKASNWGLAYTVGYPLGSVYAGAFIHLLLSYPTGRLAGRAQRSVVGLGYAVLTLSTVPFLMFAPEQDERLDCARRCPDNVFNINESAALADVIVAVSSAVGVALLATVSVFTYRRWRQASVRERRSLGPVLAIGAVAAGCFSLAAATRWAVLNWIALSLLVVLPFAFLAGLLRARLARSAVADLIVTLRVATGQSELRDALARALGDPTLELAFWLPEYGGYANAEGRTVPLPEEPGRTVTGIEQDGEPVAALVHDPSLLDEPALLEAVGAAAGMALQNARLQTELRAHVLEVKDSRARVIQAADSERKRLERDLHDGAQQRLVAITIELGRLQTKVRSDPDLRETVDRTKHEAEASLRELRDLARGLHPAVVTDHGLTVALEALVARCRTPVHLDVSVGAKLPSPVEVAIYYVVSECLANAAKHAHASVVDVIVRATDDLVVAEITDNGLGGADAHGSGLRGLADRVQALDGRLRVWSPAGDGTRVRAEIPCAS